MEFLSTWKNLNLYAFIRWAGVNPDSYLKESKKRIETKKRVQKVDKVEKILKGSLNLSPSPLPSVKIQIMGGKVCLRCKGSLVVANKLLKTKSLLTSPSNVLPYYLK